MEVLHTILLVLLVMLAIFIVLRITARRDEPNSLLLMQQQIADLRGELAQRLDGSAASVNRNLQQMHTSVAGILP
ncbi:MAG: hypothetical protein A2Z34_01700 [Planctomycetes bacterium RBG_16_59_8]|nr:MAG: hypothetical protein A2Z34_01700 [Planctomycetes bacterium RBG_16_59_8]